MKVIFSVFKNFLNNQINEINHTQTIEALSMDSFSIIDNKYYVVK